MVYSLISANQRSSLTEIAIFNMSMTSSICLTCFSSDRRMFPLNNITDLLDEVNIQNLHRNAGGVCWECHNVLVKFLRFKKQVAYSQIFLQTCNKVKIELKTLSKLTCDIKTFYDAQIVHNDDAKPVNESEIEIKDEVIDNCDVNYDLASSLYVGNVNDTKNSKAVDEVSERNKKTVRLKRKVVNIDILKEVNSQDNCVQEKQTKKVLKKDTVSLKTDGKKKVEKHCETVTSEMCEGSFTFSANDFDETEKKKPLTDEQDEEHFKIIPKTKNKISLKEINLNNAIIDRKDSTKIDRRAKSFEEGEILKTKYETVKYTEEEMTRNREEKRSGHNYKKIPYKCDTCVLGFIRKNNYEEHVAKKHDESIGTYKCVVCEVRFTNSNAVERHREKHYTCYKCKLCKFETVELWSVLNHCRIKHKTDSSDNMHCKECDVVCGSPEDLYQHVNEEHYATCNECGSKFKGKHTLRSHMRRIHGSNRQFSCEQCKLTFRSSSRLESHMSRHGELVSYCRLCKVQYNSIFVYRNHLANSKSHASKMYQCSECNKKFASKVYWKRHYDFFHLKKSKFRCQNCDKYSSSISRRRGCRVIGQHSIQKEALNLFMSRWSLTNHEQMHHGTARARTHECNICGNKFFTSSTLKGHQLTHSEERKFMCSLCGDTFKQGPSLYTHVKLVHKGLKRKPKT